MYVDRWIPYRIRTLRRYVYIEEAAAVAIVLLDMHIIYGWMHKYNRVEYIQYIDVVRTST